MRKLAAIMFTDIAGYTALMSQDEDKALQLLQKNRALLKPIIEQFRGEWLKELGDGTLSSFASAVDAVNCALVIQRTLEDDPDLSLRIGIHIGDVVFERGDVFGDGVNVASRIEPLAEPGGICVSEKVYDDIHNKPGIETTFLGEQTLKGIERPVRVFTVTEKRAVLREPEPAASLPLIRRKWAVAALGAAAAASLAVVALFYLLRGPDQEAALGAKSIAVLPFVNFSDSKDDEYFCDGITDDILTHLSKIGDLKVIARTSVMQYKNTEKRIRDIGRELGVATILEGSVRRADSRVRITSQLVDAETEEHLWAETYDRDLTDIFAIQSDVARQIAAALKATLTPEEEQRIEDRPTENLEAYDFYLRGREYGVQQKRQMAAQMCDRAVKLDSTFALAYAELSSAHTNIYWFHEDHTPKRLAMAKAAVYQALALNPDLPEAHFALGQYYYHGYLDYDRALEQFAIALKGLPNHAQTLAFIGYVQRRQGKFEQALANQRKAFDLDPRSPHTAINLAQTYRLLRRYPEAERYFNRAIALQPDSFGRYAIKAWLYVRWEGNIHKARRVLDEAIPNLENAADPRIFRERARLNMFDRNYSAALEQLAHAPAEVKDDQFGYIPRSLWYAQVYELMDQEDLARTYYDSARVLLEAKLQEDPGDSRYHSTLGIAYAGLGRREEALRAGQKGVELLPISKEAYRGYYREWDLAIIYTMVDEYEAAIDKIAYLLSIPGGLSVPWLRLDPTWDPLREHPRFGGLVEKYGER